MGLSTTHISPRPGRRAATYRRVDQAADTDRPQPIITLAVDGGVLRVKGAKRPGGPRGGGRRGVITGFSRAARNRMLELFGQLKRSSEGRLPLMLTLTYPKVWNEDPTSWKRDLDTFFKRLRRQFPSCSAVWKLEFQSRGAPHFHILLFNVSWIDRLWCARTWAEVVASGDPLHIKAGTRIERVKSWKGVMAYAAKYLAKETRETATGSIGRFWGVFNREGLPIELLELPITFGQFFRLRRLLVRWHAVQTTSGRQGTSRRKKRWRPKIGGGFTGMKLFLPYTVALQLIAAAVA